MNTLRIAWVTPRKLRSSIARFAAEVAFELARRGHGVTLLRIGAGGALAVSGRSPPRPARRLDDVPTADLQRQFDVIVVHLGDRCSLYETQLLRLRDLGAAGIFRDAFISKLDSDWATATGPVMRQPVCHTQRDLAWCPGEPFCGELPRVPRRRSMLEWLADQTAGAVANPRHSAGRSRGAGRHTTTVYVDALLPLLQQVVARRPILNARRQLSDTLAEFGLPPDDPAMARVGAALTSMQGTTSRKCHEPSPDGLRAGTHSGLPP
jgi:hypothetical protein